MDKLWNEILTIGQRILNGGNITREEAEALGKSKESDIFLLCSFANRMREKFNGNNVDLCSVINAKSGRCPEDCAFCSQSAHHHTNAKCYPLIDEDKIVETAIKREKAGAKHCDICTSGLGYTGEEKNFKIIINAFKRMKASTNLKLCACLGTLTIDAANQLAEAGVERYNHNLETARSFFPKIVSTHGYDERIDTIRYAKKAGMEVCSGMIIGLGETMEQRIEHAFLLKELDVDAVPVNVLNPVKGTRLENAKPLSPLEIIKTFALMRFILPHKNIRFAGGREKNLKSLQALGFVAGINGMLIGDYLTTEGQEVNKDFQMLQDLNLTY
ncbi:biotin synthase BioB [Clostridium luticellarii]|jgi:biotin synthase|uniref:Biotin synthase n=1 Tax=Clostridium luticellarii TaxID=1691940 RepID=A0A2T0BMU2_9CLOT|nr:biotin synthase BioB [Clostridium luticellarii]MCI1944033.1 biotin synthase BioB [Clostridium luticellarii]MCI1967325.1 biotin synthase BioB [Clostridium luticellarii]MCI1995516.1 biotin synthase BioB [Clostridium luticellarii]MCI2039189.1 biotin synthase BioB [Clostridium luticellarii]PRR85181.1 Biotin synthase [Clostridium luticellarii]